MKNNENFTDQYFTITSFNKMNLLNNLIQFQIYFGIFLKLSILFKFISISLLKNINIIHLT